MKILHVSKYYFPYMGGTEQVARDCVNALKEQHAQRVICFNHGKGNVIDEVDGIEIVRAGCFAKVASQSLSMSYKKLLKRQFREFEPDVVIFHFPNPFVAHYLLKILKKYPSCKLVVYWHLDITKQKILGKFFKGQTWRLLRRASKVIAASPNYMSGSPFLSSTKEKCVMFPYCVNDANVTVTDEVVEEAAEIRERYQGKTILFALGRHVPYKGLDHLVKAGKYLSGDFVIAIGGEGPMTPELKKLAQGDEKVVFLGKLDDVTRKAYMAACDIFCFPSVTKNEAFGLALAEAMAFGKPAVTFTIAGSGVNYVSVANETGLEVENGNDKAYAEAIETLANDGALREQFGAAARKRAYEKFTYESFSENINRTIGGLQ